MMDLQEIVRNYLMNKYKSTIKALYIFNFMCYGFLLNPKKLNYFLLQYFSSSWKMGRGELP